MKNAIRIRRTLPALFAAILIPLCFASCAKKASDADTLWSSAVYTADTALGDGETSIFVEVKAGEKSITFTIDTNAATLGEALLENDIVSGEMGAYGLYIKSVNGMVADYDTDHTYWALYENGELCMTSADLTPVADGGHYELVREG